MCREHGEAGDRGGGEGKTDGGSKARQGTGHQDLLQSGFEVLHGTGARGADGERVGLGGDEREALQEAARVGARRGGQHAQDPLVAAALLGTAESRPGPPRDRVPPEEGRSDDLDEAHPVVAPTHMRELVREERVALVRGEVAEQLLRKEELRPSARGPEHRRNRRRNEEHGRRVRQAEARCDLARPGGHRRRCRHRAREQAAEAAAPVKRHGHDAQRAERERGRRERACGVEGRGVGSRRLRRRRRRAGPERFRGTRTSRARDRCGRRPARGHGKSDAPRRGREVRRREEARARLSERRTGGGGRCPRPDRDGEGPRWRGEEGRQRGEDGDRQDRRSDEPDEREQPQAVDDGLALHEAAGRPCRQGEDARREGVRGDQRQQRAHRGALSRVMRSTSWRSSRSSPAESRPALTRWVSSGASEPSHSCSAVSRSRRATRSSRPMRAR